jgi:hypothetical protein
MPPLISIRGLGLVRELPGKYDRIIAVQDTCTYHRSSHASATGLSATNMRFLTQANPDSMAAAEDKGGNSVGKGGRPDPFYMPL